MVVYSLINEIEKADGKFIASANYALVTIKWI